MILVIVAMMLVSAVVLIGFVRRRPHT